MAGRQTSTMSEEEKVSGESALAEEEEEELLDDEALLEDNAVGASVANDSLQIADEINVNTFDELRLSPQMISQAQGAWQMFVNSASSREAAGEAIYAALFEGAPTLQSLFTTPRAVQAMRFMAGLSSFVTALDEPPKLKVLVESLGFGHLHLDVTIPRVIIFRDAIMDLFAVELGSRLSTDGRLGWLYLLNYVGGAIIFCKSHYAERINILNESWKKANKETGKDDTQAQASEAHEDGKETGENAEGEKKSGGFFGTKKEEKNEAEAAQKEAEHSGNSNGMLKSIPQNFPDMFMFNAAVMGMGDRLWMNEVLACFHNIVTNVSNSGRLQEECDVLSLRINKLRQGSINLAEYKSCMLASLRSLLPGSWNTAHEVAWSWLWENVERLVKGCPFFVRGNAMERAYAKVLDGLEEQTKYELRADIYTRFFSSTPAGQDYFKQSNTYLHLIADKVLDMALDIYRDPVRMIDDVSALGLRHVGYAIPTEFFGPFVTACVEVTIGMKVDDRAVDAFRCSLGLVAKMLVRTINEGSTIVMKAINTNSKKSMTKAVSCAPRGERAAWMLLVQVGSQTISPLAWSLQSGSLEAASTMIVDLLTIRADRDKYYYALDELYERHPDLIKMLIDEAPVLLPTFFDGLIWRSRINEGGTRRVNYYIKHLVVDAEGKYAMTLPWIVSIRDPELVCHPILVFLNDLLWSRVVYRAFLKDKIWLFLTAAVFCAGQAVKETHEYPAVVFGIRVFVYLCSMGLMIYHHTRNIIICIQSGRIMKVLCFNVPDYLQDWQESVGLALALCLFAMFAMEPILACYKDAMDANDPFAFDCEAAKTSKVLFGFVSAVGMFLYCILLMDMSVFSNRVSSYVLTCGQLVSELGLFIIAGAVTILTFSSAMSCLDQDLEYFKGIPSGGMALFEITLALFNPDKYEELKDEPVVLAIVYVFVIVAFIFLVNLLVAQLKSSYGAILKDMVGYARLGRLTVICDALPKTSKKRWNNFVQSMHFDERIEFNEGDIGLAGGVQIREPSSENPTTVDMIKRFGGSTSQEMPWPQEDLGDGDDDKFERVEKLVQAFQKRVAQGSGGSRHKAGSGGGSAGAGASGSGEIAASGSGEQGGGANDDAQSASEASSNGGNFSPK